MEWIEYWDKINSNLSKRITVILCGKDNGIICYGINLFINGIEKITVLITVFYFMGCLQLFFASAIVMCLLRIWMGGTHRKTLLGCLIQSFLVFGIAVLLAKQTDIDFGISCLAMLAILVVDTICCPIIDSRRGGYSKKRILQIKIKSVGCILILNVFGMLIFEEYRTIITVCEILEILDVYVALLKLHREEKMTKLAEKINDILENITIDVYSSTASQFLWGEIEAPQELKEKVEEKR